MRTRQATTPPAPLVASGDADVKVGAGAMKPNDNIDRYVGGHLATRWGRLTDDPPIGWFTRKHTEYDGVHVTHLFYDITPEHYHHGEGWWREWDACCEHIRERESDLVGAVAPFHAEACAKSEATYGRHEKPWNADGSGIEPQVAHLPTAHDAVLRSMRVALGGRPNTSTPTTLYRFFDADDRLLYVGIAGNPGRRFHQHANGPDGKPWWGQVTRSTMEHFATREAAAAAEVAAIVAERPLHNVVHNKGKAYLTARRARFEFGETPTPPAKPTRTTARPADAARAELAADRAEHATA